MGLLVSLGWIVGVGVIFGLRPKITPTYSLDHGNTKEASKFHLDNKVSAYLLVLKEISQ